MKRLHYVYISAIMALLCLVACQQDDEVSGIKDGSGFVTVTLRIIASTSLYASAPPISPPLQPSHKTPPPKPPPKNFLR